MAGNLALGWWIAAGLLVAGELATGTFYLLMIAIGFAAAALSAYVGAGLEGQVIAAALVGGGAVVAWHRLRPRSTRTAPESNPDINLDIGERVQVPAWGADGTARVLYRGTSWNARFVGEGAPGPGEHVIAQVRHNELALRRLA
jgi:membrane protein implicated in regulation of membrane protease activity